MVPRPRRIPLLRTVLATSVLLVLCAVLALFFLRVDRVVVARGHLAGGSCAVRSPLDGTVARVLVQGDQAVRAGEPLVVLESSALTSERRRSEARIDALESRIAALRARREHLGAVSHPNARHEAELARERAQLELDTAARELSSLETLVGDGLVDRVSVDEARLRHDVAEVALNEARLKEESLAPEEEAELAGVDAEVSQAQSLLDEERLAAAELAREEALATVVAPEAGTVVGTELQDLVGRRLLAGDELLAIADGRADHFVGRVADRERPHVQRAMAVRLRVDGYPWMLHGSVPGRVSSVAESAGKDGGYPVEVALEGGSGLELFEGMQADARILVEERVRLGELLLEKLVAR